MGLYWKSFPSKHVLEGFLSPLFTDDHIYFFFSRGAKMTVLLTIAAVMAEMVNACLLTHKT